MTIPILVASFLLGATGAVVAAEPPPASSGPPAPAPAAASAVAPTQLKEIGRVRVTVCSSVLVHANAAISASLRNDATMAQTVHLLRTLDFDANELNYHNGVANLDKFAGLLHDDAVRGVGEVKRLRELAKQTTDPARKADLEKFADAVGGALYRQKKASVDLSGFIAYLQERQMRGNPGNDPIDMAAAKPEFNMTRYTPTNAFLVWHTDTPDRMAQSAADDFALRQNDIAIDEGTAADHAEGAVSGC